VHQTPRPDTYGATFLPKQRSYQEKMWITILHKSEYQSKSIDELFQMFRPLFICQNKDLNVLKKDPNEILFEEKDSMCYGRRFRTTIARLVKGQSSISFYAYRADLEKTPEGRREFVLKTITSVPLDKPTSEKSVASADSAAANAGPSTAASPH